MQNNNIDAINIYLFMNKVYSVEFSSLKNRNGGQQFVT